ncbi:MAG: peptidoglycan-binding domain-containing protein [Patescibacteria group bacterium]
MKKVIFVAGVAVLALAAVTSAAFSTNLTVGSTGADVTALQTWLITNNFHIAAIESGVAAKGYFGSQTKAALAQYQASVGLPAYGFFGPLTQAKLNGGSALPGVGTITPPVGQGSTAPTGITTPGIPGTLVFALQSTYNNPTLDKSKSVDVARFKLQASASDMAVTSLSMDFNKRLWLYVGSLTVRDDAGNVIASKSNLSSADFSEITVGSSYRLTLPASYIVAKSAIKYVTVNVTALSATDRTSAETIAISQAQVRAVDGTGVTDTETDNVGSNSLYPRNIAWTGANNNNLVATIDASSPATNLVQISSSVETDNVVLGIYDLKSQNNDSNLRTLKITVGTNGTNISTLFSDVRVKIGGNSFSADTLPAASTGLLTFSNINTILTKDTYVPVTIVAKVAKNVTGTATTSLTANTTNIAAEDSSYNTVSVSTSGAITSNPLTFTVSGVAVASLATTYGSKTCASDLTTCVQSFTFAFGLTAGDSAIYVPTNVFSAIATSSTPAGFTITKQDFADNNTSGDAAGYFYIAPGQTKTFTAQYQASASSTAGGNVQVLALTYGTTTAATGGALSSSDIQNGLKAVLFH